MKRKTEKNRGLTGRANNQAVYDILGRNSVHPFPARMAPDLVLEVIEENKNPMRILDPMSGSGTVLAIARSKGHRATGVDLDPLAVLISRVWTTAIDSEVVREKAVEVLNRARCVFTSLRTRDAYPKNADVETQRFIRYWFDDYARRQLYSLAVVIQRVRDDKIRDALWCAFSRLIITKQSGASLAMDLSHSRPHRVFDRAPSKPFWKFPSAVDRVIRNCIDSNRRPLGPVARVYEGDARNLSLDDGSFDLILMSPPYLNAIDYLRCSKFSLVWMGYSVGEMRRLRSSVVGAEIGGSAGNYCEIRSIISELNLRPRLERRQEAMLAHYIHDMKRVVKESSRVLTDDGQAVYVIGENTVRGTFIPNALIIEAVADAAGLHCTARRSRKLPENRRYLPPPSTQSGTVTLNRRMRRETILTFKKAI